MADAILTDPLGRRITLHDSTWYGHIIKGHPEVTRDRFLVHQAVTSPDLIQHSTSDADCRIYYGRPSATGRIIAVVADAVVGVVKTAYAAKRSKKGTVEWSRPTP